jgi:hypothetical protein
MTVERAIRILAGTIVLASLALAQWVSAWFLLATVFVGANLLQSGFTRFCPAETVLRRFGIRGGCSAAPGADREVG